MRHALLTLLMAFVLAASGLTPVCEIACGMARERTMPANAAAAAPWDCQHGAGEAGKEQKSSPGHPRKKGAHQHGELSVSPAAPTEIQIAGKAMHFVGFDGSPALKAASTAPLDSAWGEAHSPPHHRASPLSLRI